MIFEEKLSQLLPDALPNRARVVELGARHLEMIVEANRQFNLTRILDPEEAAIKHVCDSVTPWELFARSSHVVDAGTGAGFPGVPLALVLPEVQFTLCESIGKKARFVEEAVQHLGLMNVRVAAIRAEEFLRGAKADVLTARAVAPIGKAAALFGAALTRGTRALLYKGPEVEGEIRDADAELRRVRLRARIVERYELPAGYGSRTIVEVASAGRSGGGGGL